ncbi:MAG: hypothetical protein ACPG77_16270, partial [Nannocystaceae bacterium]
TVGYYTQDPVLAQQVVAAYNQEACAARHPVNTGMAPSIFSIAPEFGFKIHKKMVLSVFGRLQVVTGSKVYRDDPGKNLDQSFAEDVISPAPSGTKSNPGFTAAGGAKLRYFFGSDSKKFRVFIGGYLGGGFARLRVPMGFANDRNGNSVPDNIERSSSLSSGACVNVWPYTGCDSNGQPVDDPVALVVAMNADASQRIDTVRIGGAMIGATFGFNYQIVKNFALFAEIQAGGWFPASSSILFDLVAGPAITF